MKQQLKIAPDLALPLDTVMDKKAILAKTGAGKSTTAADYVEETLDAGVQVVVIDPKGDWWGLRSSADGKSAGYPVTVMGGLRGDIPLEAGAGKLMGEFFARNAVSAVLDLSDFTNAEMYRFAADFASAFYRAKRHNPTPMLLALAEADELVPEGVTKIHGPDLPRCIGAFTRIWKRGRFIGIGCLLETQRSADVGKKILSQTDILIAMRTTDPRDIAAIDAWLETQPDQEKRKEVKENLQSLPTGHGYVWAPERGIFQRVHFRRRRTFDAGETPKIGKAKLQPKILAKVDLQRLEGEMRTFVERAKESDPAALRARIRELEDALKRQPKLGTAPAGSAAARPQASAREVDRAAAAATRESEKKLRELAKAHEEECAALERLADQERDAKTEAIDALMRAQGSLFTDSEQLLDVAQRIGAHRGVKLAVRRLEKAREARREFVAAIPTPSVNAEPAARDRPVVRTKHASRTTAPPPSRARTRALAGESEDGAAVPVKAGARRMLQALAQYHPRTLSRVQVGFAAGIAASKGTGRDYFSALHRNGFIEYGPDGRVAITPAGLAHLGDDVPEQPATIDALQASWRAKLKAGAARMFDILVSTYPDGLTREQLEEKADIHGGTFRDYLSAIRRLELIEEKDRIIRASPELFELAGDA